MTTKTPSPPCPSCRARPCPWCRGCECSCSCWTPRAWDLYRAPRLVLAPATPAASVTRPRPGRPARRPSGPGKGPGSVGGPHSCPAGPCRAWLGPWRLLCRPHWRAVPRPLRALAWAAWRAGAGTGDPAYRHAAAVAIAAARAAGPR
jgi:hypothetical protein